MNLENRIEKLESRTQQENAPAFFILSVRAQEKIDGWRTVDGNTFWRLHGETDDALLERIKKALNPEPATLVMLRAIERELNFFD